MRHVQSITGKDNTNAVVEQDRQRKITTGAGNAYMARLLFEHEHMAMGQNFYRDIQSKLSFQYDSRTFLPDSPQQLKSFTEENAYRPLKPQRHSQRHQAKNFWPEGSRNSLVIWSTERTVFRVGDLFLPGRFIFLDVAWPCTQSF